MRLTVDVWMEIIKEALARGESAVVAISKANLVTDAYIARFVVTSASEDRIPAEYFTPFSQTKEKHEESLSIPATGYIAGDPNVR